MDSLQVMDSLQALDALKVDHLKKAKIRSIFSTLDALARIQLIY